MGKQAGRGFTAARRRASRLAGLVRLPAGCIAKTAIRRQASWLATKASVILISRWPFALQNIQAALKHPTSQGVRMPVDAQEKVQETLSKIINEGNGGMICILL